MPDLPLLAARCDCGAVEVEARGPPILVTACHCDDCQEAGRRLAALPGRRSPVGEAGGTDALMLRRDRVRIARGADRLESHRLKPDSRTQRLVASCCGTPMLLDFAPGHWIDAYRAAFGPAAPPVEMRVMTKFAPAGSIPAGVPAARTHSAAFFARLLAAWVPMLLHPRRTDLRPVAAPYPGLPAPP